MTTEQPDIAHVIQLAVAPVFLLAGIGAILGVLTSRLARVVDRFRSLQVAGEAARPAPDAEMRGLVRRARWIHWAISLCTTSALLICIVIAMLFVGSVTGSGSGATLAVLFVLAMAALILGLLCFLREIFLATGIIALER